MTLVGDVIAYLAKRRTKSALIGAEALAVHGIARSTLDSDLLVASPDVLRAEFWSKLPPPAAVEIRSGDADDPLAGVVRVRRRNEQTDVIVGRPWTRTMLARTLHLRVGGEDLPVVDGADLILQILLKLFAAGPQDLLDVRLLLERAGGDLSEQVERRLTDVPAEIARTYRHLLRAPL
jgi:hypothetical protein